MKKKINLDRYFVVDESFINAVISNYHKWMMKEDSCGIPWEEREDFIKNEFRKGLKRVCHPCYTVEDGLEKYNQWKERQERKKMLEKNKKEKRNG